MDRRTIAQRKLNAVKARREYDEIAQRVAERRAARTTEAIARLAVWKQQVVTENERRGLSLGC